MCLYYCFCDDEEWGGASDWVISSVHPISFQLLHSSLNTKRPRMAMTMILVMVFVIMILMTITMILIMAIIFVSDQKIFGKVLVCTDLKHTNVLFIKVFGLFLNSSTALFTFRIQCFFFKFSVSSCSFHCSRSIGFNVLRLLRANASPPALANSLS